MTRPALQTRLRRYTTTALLVMVVAASALATVVVHADVNRLAELADAVVDAKVEKRAVAFEAERGAIWTTYELAVSKTLLGDERERVTVHVPGGAVGDIEQEVSGTAQMKVGQRVVLFLTKEAERLQVLGQAQGCFRVERDDASKALVCRNDLEGLALVTESGDGVDARPIEMRLDELVRRVERVATRRAEAERQRREAQERKLEELRIRAERNAEKTRGKPGGAK